jgi:hypothetical protein
MTTIPQVAQALQQVLITSANGAGKSSGFVQRRSKLSGATFTQTLVFGWQENGRASLGDLAQTALALGVSISAQGLDQRFTEKAATFLKQVLVAAVEEMIATEPVAIPILQRFNGVYLLDSSTINLPSELAQVWAGCGNRVAGGEAALKFQILLNITTGALQGPELQDGREHDRSSSLQVAALPAGALRLADLGYFSMDLMRSLGQKGVFWLSRLQTNTVAFDATGQRVTLSAMLKAQPSETIDLDVSIGLEQHLLCRLVAQRVPPEVAAKRRRRLKDEARRRKQPVNHERWLLAEWTIYVTNVPRSLLSPHEALVLAHVRWQIELLIKLWKSHGCIDESRSAKRWRILCEVYAKLLAMLIQHWLLLISCWCYPDRSLPKAAKTLQKHARHLELAFKSPERLVEAITDLCRCLAHGCRINKSKKDPRTYQELMALDDGALA